MRIIDKQILTKSSGPSVTKFVIESPEIAASAKPGQFVAVMASEKGERIPLTIADINAASGTITIIFQAAGLTTKLLGKMNVGEKLYAMTGPLGHPTDIKFYGKVIIVGGGIGIAEIYPVARALKNASNHVTVIIGARTKDLLMLENELKDISDELYVTTDDGSSGRKAFTTDVLGELLAKTKYDLVYSVGPIPMMKRSSEVTKPFGAKTIVSLNALMVDATGMCGCCRVTIGGKVKFSCVDGPEFDASLVDWEELTKRNNIYADKEKHICNLPKP